MVRLLFRGNFFLFAFFILLLSGCASTSSQNRVPQNAEQVYQQGHQQLENRALSAATTTLNEMERRFPLHVRTHQLYLELADAYHADEADEKALKMAMRFVRRFPNHRDVDYAYYIMGVADFSRAVVALAPNNPNPDPGFAYEAMGRFLYLIRNYPQSLYQVHARDHTAYLRVLLAQYELRQIERLLANNQATEAMERASDLVVRYPETPAAKAAKTLLAERAERKDEKPVPPTEPAVALDAASAVVVAPSPKKEETEVSVAEEKKGTPAASSEGDTWVMSRNARSYTIQIAGNSKLKTLQAEMAELGIADQVIYFKRMLNGKPWYSAIHGDYASRREGLAATQALKSRLGKKDLWLRRFGKIQQSMAK